MKLIKYKTYPDVKVEEEEYSGTPYMLYKECSSGIYLEVVVDDEDVDKVYDALHGDLPESVLAVLGLDVEGEDLEEICEGLKERGFRCEFEVEEGEEYCQSMKVTFGGSSRLVKVIVENGSLRVLPAKDEEYLKYQRKKNRVVVEAVVPATVLSALEGKEDKAKALAVAVVPALKDADLDDPVSVVEALESLEGYKICIERRGDNLTWVVR